MREVLPFAHVIIIDVQDSTVGSTILVTLLFCVPFSSVWVKAVLVVLSERANLPAVSSIRIEAFFFKVTSRSFAIIVAPAPGFNGSVFVFVRPGMFKACTVFNNAVVPLMHVVIGLIFLQSWDTTCVVATVHAYIMHFTLKNAISIWEIVFNHIDMLTMACGC